MAAPAIAPADLQAVIQTARSALASIHGAVPDLATVRQAEASLQQVKSSLSIPAALEVGGAFLSPLLAPSPVPLVPEQAPALHFGFHVIDENALLPEWMAVANDEDRARLRHMALTVVSLVSAPSARNCFPKWVRQKAAALVAALAMREWPQCWPKFVDELLALSQASPGSQDIVCEVFKTLSDDVHEFGDRISSKRRAELSKGLTETEDTILSFVTNCTQTFFEVGDSAGLSAALETLSSIMAWCDMAKAMKAGVPVALLGLLKQCLYHELARDAALEALSVFVSRKVPSSGSAVAAATEEATQRIRDVLFPAVLEFVATTPALVRLVSSSALPICDGFFEGPAKAALQAELTAPRAGVVGTDLHGFSVRFVEMLSALGQAHFGVCFLPYQLSPKELATEQLAVALAYVDLILASVAHRSLLVREAALRFFATAFSRQKASSKKKKLSEPAHGSVDAAMTTQAGKQILFDIALGFLHAGTLGLVYCFDSRDEVYAALDFEDDEAECKDVLNVTKNRIISTLGTASACWPSDCFPIAVQRTSVVLNMCVAALQSGVSLSPQTNGQATGRRSLIEKAPSSNQRHAWVLVPIASADAGPLLLSYAHAIVSTSEAVIAGCMSTRLLENGSVQSAAFRNDFERLFDEFAGLGDVPLQTLRVSALKLFIPLFLKDNGRLTRALSVLVQLASGDGPSTEARTSASSSLATLCRRISKSESSAKPNASVQPQALSSVCKPLCQFVAPALLHGNRSAREKANLMEAAVTCLTTIGDVTQRALWMKELVQPLMDAVHPSQDWCKAAFDSPSALMAFLCEGSSTSRSAFFLSLGLLESVTHQVVRDASHASSALTLPNSLSNSIAPLCVEVAVKLIPILHGMYDDVKFPLRDQERYQSALLPTSREVACLLNLDGSSMLNAVHIPEVDADGLVVDSATLERSCDKLRQFGIVPPDPAHQKVRETLRLLRIGSYELIRNSLLSGVTASDLYLGQIVSAMCSSYQYLEPLHMYYLVNRVLRIMLSHQVVSTDARFMASISASPGVCGIVTRMNEQIGSTSSSGIVSSDNATLDFAREHGRLRLCQGGADLIAGLFSKVVRSTAMPEVFKSGPPSEGVAFAPVPLCGNTALSHALWSLVRTLCGPDVARADSAASRTTCNVIARAAHQAPEDLGVDFAGALVACFHTAVCTHGRDADDTYIMAVVDLSLRYPSQCTMALGDYINSESETVQGWIKTAFTDFLTDGGADRPASAKGGGGSLRKKGRNLMRHLIKRISEETGLSMATKKKVRSLPKSRRTNAQKPAKSTQGDTDEFILADHALDSLYGDGAPL